MNKNTMSPVNYLILPHPTFPDAPLKKNKNISGFVMQL